MGDLLPIMQEVEVHHLQEDLQASDRGRMREQELSRFNFFMIDHIFAKTIFQSYLTLLQASSKTEKKSGKAAGGDGYQPVMMTFKVGILMVLGKG